MSSSHDANKAADETVAPEESARQRREPRIDPQAGHILNYTPVSRVMRAAIPGDVMVSRDAIELMQDCVSEFISFVTSEAEKRRAVSADDVLTAMNKLGFQNYSEALKIYLRRYNEVHPGDNSLSFVRRQKKDPGATSTSGPTNERQEGNKEKEYHGSERQRGQPYGALPRQSPRAEKEATVEDTDAHRTNCLVTDLIQSLESTGRPG
ncbi:Nuclear transcription factor Y subunit B-8 [Fonsecaea pedrosoi]|nr:Nuclear transcription factor Y subunit B-8 [Fonsecaea pedrosoi]